jgi:hypothetical protein
MLIRSQNHVATAPAITAIRSAFWHKFLPPETYASTSSIARLREHFDSIDKHIALKLPLARTHVIPSRADDEGPHNRSGHYAANSA